MLTELAGWYTQDGRLRARPLRVVYVVLTLAILMPVPPMTVPVSAHAPNDFIESSSFQTDNLFRWGLRNSTVETALNTNIWCLPLRGICNGSAVITQNTIEDRIAFIGCLAWGCTSSGGVTQPTWGSSGQENKTSMFNWTWDVPVPMTNFLWHADAATSTSGGTLTYWFHFYNNGTMQHLHQSAAVGCNQGPGVQQFSFERITITNVSVGVDATGCTSTSLNYRWVMLGAWAAGKRSDANFVDTALEYADWAVTNRTNTLTAQGGSWTNNISQGEHVFALEAGVTWLFTQQPGCTSNLACLTTSFRGSIAPQAGVLGKEIPGIEVEWYGMSACRQVLNICSGKGGPLNVWRVDNQLGFTTFYKMGGTSKNDASTGSAIFNIWDDHDIGGSTLGIPVANTLRGDNVLGGGTAPGSGPAFMFWLRDNAAALGTSSFEFLTDPEANIQFQRFIQHGSTNTTEGVITSQGPWFNFSLTQHDYHGNAVFFVLGIPLGEPGAGFDNGACDNIDNPNSGQFKTHISVNLGEPLLPFRADVVTQDTTIGGTSTALLKVCWWLLDDFTRREGLPDDESGNHLGLDNSREPVARTYRVRVLDPLAYFEGEPQVVALYVPDKKNGGRQEGGLSSTGDPAPNYQCTPIGVPGTGNMGPVCYGNVDTIGLELSSAIHPAVVNVHTRDVTDDVPVDLPDVRIFESKTSLSFLTNETGRKTFNITPEAVRFSFAKNGYNTVYLNLTFNVFDNINLTIDMTREKTQPFSRISCNPDGDTIVCEATPTADAGESCNEIDASRVACRDGFTPTPKVYAIECPRLVQPLPEPFKTVSVIPQVSVTATPQGVAVTTDQGTDPFPQNDCEDRIIRNITSNTQTFTWSKPGYRSLTFTVNDGRDFVKLLAALAKGSGEGTATVHTTFTYNTTVDGRLVSAVEYRIYDSGPGATGISDNPLDISRDLVNLGAGLGAFGIVWGLFIVLGMVITLLIVWKKLFDQAPHPYWYFGVSSIGLMMTTVIGLIPFWVLAGLIILSIIGLAFMLTANRGGSIG